MADPFGERLRQNVVGGPAGFREAFVNALAAVFLLAGALLLLYPPTITEHINPVLGFFSDNTQTLGFVLIIIAGYFLWRAIQIRDII